MTTDRLPDGQTIPGWVLSRKVMPMSVDVMGHNFKVTEMNLQESRDNDGCCMLGLQEIQIAPGNHPDVMWETLCLEIMEAVNSIAELGLDHRTITILGNAVFQSFGGLTW